MRKSILVLIPLLIFAQDFILQKDVLSSGGRKMTSTDYILNGTISQTAIGAVTDTDYKGVIGFWHPPEPFPPNAPYIYVTKSGNDAVLTWNKITTDTLGNPETMYYYVVYRSTDPSFIPGNSDSIGITLQPDTTYTDAGANSIAVPSYYYLVKAVDVAGNLSKKSNMGYKFNKFVNENTGATSDRNWVSLPWHNEYATVSDITDDVSPAGDPLVEATNLRNDQLYESWVYDMFFGWFGTNFTVDNGRGYELVTNKDTTLVIVGSNNPNGLVPLNENSGSTSDRNWVSIPYNAAYSTVSNVTTEYCPSGDPLIELTNLRNDQLYESWIYDMFFGWFGSDFSIDAGRAYEFVTVIDTIWNPSEYSNRTFDEKPFVSLRKTTPVCACRLGFQQSPDRQPIWGKNKPILTSSVHSKNIEKADDYVIIKDTDNAVRKDRDAGIPHIVFGTFEMKEVYDIAFTVYRSDAPYDILTEDIIGCGMVEKDTHFGIWFNTGNFKEPWTDNEEIVILVEAATSDNVYYDVKTVTLDQGMDIQPITGINLEPVPEIRTNKGILTWNAETKEPVIGYSIYSGDQRLNDHILTGNEFTAKAENVIVRPVIKGGYETVLSPTGIQEKPQVFTPISYSFNVFPNPFAGQTGISYALPRKAAVAITIYDVTGRQVKVLVSGSIGPGCYTVEWNGNDDLGRVVAAGVYFITIKTGDYQSQEKVILVR